MTFSLASLDYQGQIHAALKQDDNFWLLAGAEELGLTIPASLIEVVKDWDNTFPVLKAIASAAAEGRLAKKYAIHETEACLALPLQYPRKVFCTGANYADHLEEMGVVIEKDHENGPFFYLKPASSSLVGPGDSVHIPSGCNYFDWEAEMVVVFGRSGRDISVERALDYVAAYTLGVDFTARDQMETTGPFKFDFTLGKCQDRTAPIGPVLVPKEFIDGENIFFQLDVNGERKQSTSTANMTYSLAEQIAGISKRVLIEAGDILFTGSPAGVGFARGERLKIGDKVAVAAESIGVLEVVIQPPLSQNVTLAA